MTRSGRSARLRRNRRPNVEERGDTTSDALPTLSDPGVPSSSRRVTGRLVALSASAVLTVYSAGYLRTRTAAERVAGAEEDRRSLGRAPSTIGLAIPPAPTIGAPTGAGVTPRDSQAIQ